MKFSDEVLMAYARGTLDEAERSEIERAMRADPGLAARIARHRALRAHAYDTYGAVLHEPPPPARMAGGAGKVVQLDAVRAARQQAQQPAPVRSRWSWRQWAVLAAALAIGALEGVFAYSLMQGESGLAAVDGKGGALLAQGVLAQALSNQPAGGDGKVRIGLSFASKDGSYCRSFAFGGATGLACRQGERWHIPVMAEAQDNVVPVPVRDVIAQRIMGAPLDEQGERAAQKQGWRR
ncbi:hypothetical protein NX774_18565 [Massilia agilis]|uniref:Anti-sigma factor n=1 Tax=Massilia agilis TaxID=1811226 RepID=A0ABT2DGG0_9BURK|nr:hypothetical protein [Massilia agilis]MCS0809929.1 hypothetical protein [Massilia agilis]